jgi:hypothetical protein
MRKTHGVQESPINGNNQYCQCQVRDLSLGCCGMCGIHVYICRACVMCYMLCVYIVFNSGGFENYFAHVAEFRYHVVDVWDSPSAEIHAHFESTVSLLIMMF